MTHPIGDDISPGLEIHGPDESVTEESAESPKLTALLVAALWNAATCGACSVSDSSRGK